MQTKLQSLLAASFILGTQPAWCQSLEFKALKIGQQVADIEKTMPGLKCERIPDRLRALGDAVCRIPPITECDRLRELTAWKECYFRAESVATFAGAQTISVQLWLLDGLLSRITVDLRPADFDSVADAISEKYGPPAADRQFVVRTMAGVEHQNRSLTWVHTDGGITGQRYGLNTAQATVSLASRAAQQRQDDATPSAKDRAKDL